MPAQLIATDDKDRKNVNMVRHDDKLFSLSRMIVQKFKKKIRDTE